MAQGKDDQLRHGDLGSHCVHICVDMQRLFAERTDWHTPWMTRVLPKVEEIARCHADATIFTRFIPATHPGEGVGTWKRYYETWSSMTVERLGREMVDLVAPLARLVPPAETFDKWAYSPWVDPAFDMRLRRRGADTAVITGGETDVCVLATVLGAVDRGYRVIVVKDALCSSSDTTHDALMTLYIERYGQQVEVVSTATLLDTWT